jgi:aspartate-semialdehyde dehydrogenase
MRSFNIGIVGATGLVGSLLINLLKERAFPVKSLKLFASKRSHGKCILTPFGEMPCHILSDQCFDALDFVFFDASDQVSKEWVPAAIKSGAIVIDNSSTFRMESDVPLLIPEINAEHISDTLAKHKLFSGPNCSTVQLALTLFPLHRAYHLKRVIVSSYQSTSGAGRLAMEELKEQTFQALQKLRQNPQIFKHPIGFNCIPQIGSIASNGYSSEENKIIAETKKILNCPQLHISATAVRVPVDFTHAESVSIECEKDFTLPHFIATIKTQSGLKVCDKPDQYPLKQSYDVQYPSAAHQDPVWIGRIRKDLDIPGVAHFWIVADNLRKGAALNAIQIAEHILPYI